MLPIRSVLLGPVALEKAKEVSGSHVEIFTANPQSSRHCPDSESSDANRLFYTGHFSFGMKGNATFGTPKASYKIKLPQYHFLGMTTLTLNSMWNDVSQMREALVWRMFREMGIPASGHTYAKLCINGKYYGLYSFIEEIDRAYIDRRYPGASEGNLYKANYSRRDLGPADLNLREDGKYFIQSDKDDRTYELKTHEKNKKNKAFNNYRDLKKFIETLHAHDPRSQAFEDAMENIMEVNYFLKWAAVNVLVGAWDNYWVTPANYSLYNSGTMEAPYFRWLPWDYDHSFGITYGGSDVQNTDLISWGGLPLIRRLLENNKYRSWYFAHLDFALNHFFNERWVNREVERLWSVVERPAFLESDSAHGTPHTGRQYTNDQVYWNGREHHLFERWQGIKIYGILHYVRMRHESAKRQLRDLSR